MIRILISFRAIYINHPKHVESLEKVDLTILTEDKYENPKEIDAHISNVLAEDQCLKEALENQGLIVNRVSWSNTDYDWSTSKHVIFRSTWDYYYRFDDFIRWLGKVSRQTSLINPFKLAQWNLDKHYLKDLEQKGIPVVPTTYIRPLTRTTLKEILEANNWSHAVLKPAISGSARHTYKIQPHNVENHEAVFSRLIKEEAMMVQPFMENIVDQGEISMVVINGKCTHAVLKKAQLGEFRVQSEYGGSVERFHATSEMIELAETTVKACPYFPLYGRIDLVWDNNNQLAVVEVELIEPELFFLYNKKAADLLATTIIDYIN